MKCNNCNNELGDDEVCPICLFNNKEFKTAVKERLHGILNHETNREIKDLIKRRKENEVMEKKT
jgi:hypothetical protein